MKYTSEQYYRMWLAGIDSVGAMKYRGLLERYGSAEAVWRGFDESFNWMGERQYEAIKLARDRSKAQRQAELLEKIGARAVFEDDADYPKLLLGVDNRPPILYVLGNGEALNNTCVAIVGTRTPTEYGVAAASAIARDLALKGVTVVSGFAAGVDSAAHEGCVGLGCPTVAVFACGVDHVYPSENKGFLGRLLGAGGAVISEYPPGTKPMPGRFAARNRIISGMSRGTLVIQGAMDSGANKTANLAILQGRPLFALPGSVFEPMSVLPHALIRKGAQPATSASDIMLSLGLEVAAEHSEPEPAQEPAQPRLRVAASVGKPKRSAERERAVTAADPNLVRLAELGEDERKVYEIYVSGTRDVDEIVAKSGIFVAEVNSILTSLQLEGII